ncbi:MAG: SMP-30/gluconolactonase/LRE family protein [Gemmatimonadaceae bacterium]|nr:SMP-30/gluconolactonase/LRE family protein [Chitinophagaceae bacterium]
MVRAAISSILILFFTGTQDKFIGSIERLDVELNSIVVESAKIEIISDGYEWAEGPLWLESSQALLFTDVPTNSVYKWKEGEGVSLYLKPSGYTDRAARGGETGANGLTLDNNGKLILCQHGNRQIARMESDLLHPRPVYKSVAANYQGKRFNSPNDVVVNSKGEVFFTDPPYGLEKGMTDPAKELQFQGVFKVTKGGKVILLTDTLTRPNGIAFMPGEKSLLVANSDPARACWYAFDFNESGELIHPRIFYNATEAAKTENGSPDGLKVDTKGNVFATGPGGVWIFNKNGKLLGKIKVPVSTSNCALTADERTLFITADMYLLRVKLR